MKKRLVLGIIVVLIIAVAVYFIISGNSTNPTTNITESAAKWIGDHSVLYVQYGCIHCKAQEDMFGSYLNDLNIIDLYYNPDKAISANITATPTWIINGQKYVGVQSISTLEKLTGYTA